MAESYEFYDALMDVRVSCGYPAAGARLTQVEEDGAKECPVLFFPGCSVINYATPLLNPLFDLLHGAGWGDGMSLLCCGKILSYEPDGARVRAAYEERLRAKFAEAGVKRIVAACPNCVKALRDLLAADELTAGIEVHALPAVIAQLGYRIDAATAASVVAGDASTCVKLAVHDSCPDRATGEFAEGTRQLFAEGLLVEMAHNRKRSQCCGSLVRAAGKFEAADRAAAMRAEEGQAAGADALVTACMSCAFLLNAAQKNLHAYHYLELLYRWPIAWEYVGAYMKLRFLIEQPADSSDRRSFMALG